MKIQLKGLIYFELQQTSNYSHFELDPSYIYFELVELRINRVRINRSRPVAACNFC